MKWGWSRWSTDHLKGSPLGHTVRIAERGGGGVALVIALVVVEGGAVDVLTSCS